jgi:hypothetical protein
MADPAPPPNESAIGAVARLGQNLITTLPPAFLGLVLINAIFIGAILWFLDNRMTERTALVDKIVDRCLTQAGEAEAATARLDALEHDVRALEAKGGKP